MKCIEARTHSGNVPILTKFTMRRFNKIFGQVCNQNQRHNVGSSREFRVLGVDKRQRTWQGLNSALLHQEIVAGLWPTSCCTALPI